MTVPMPRMEVGRMRSAQPFAACTSFANLPALRAGAGLHPDMPLALRGSAHTRLGGYAGCPLHGGLARPRRASCGQARAPVAADPTPLAGRWGGRALPPASGAAAGRILRISLPTGVHIFGHRASRQMSERDAHPSGCTSLPLSPERNVLLPDAIMRRSCPPACSGGLRTATEACAP